MLERVEELNDLVKDIVQRDVISCKTTDDQEETAKK